MRRTYVKGLNYPGINPGHLSVSTAWLKGGSTIPATWSACSSGTCSAPGNLAKVMATYAYSLSVPFVPAATLNLTSTSQMVISQ